MTVGERIRDRRKALGIEVEDLAKAVGLRPTTLYDLEIGRSKSTTKLHHIARELGVSVDFLETGRTSRIADAAVSSSSHALRMDPETIASAIKLVRLSFQNLGLEFDNEQDGVPLAYAYEYLLSREQHVVTAENLVDFSKKLAERLRGKRDNETADGNAQRPGGSDRSASQRRKAS
jgi:transcriptional regulator with XRE-family HTH domain